jgi:hypothetical protein
MTSLLMRMSESLKDGHPTDAIRSAAEFTVIVVFIVGTP